MNRAQLWIVGALAMAAVPVFALPPGAPTTFRMLDWDALLPPSQHGASTESPSPVHDYLGEGGMAALQSGSSQTNPQLDKSSVKIPGFIVPLDNLANNMVREFFLVPYFGACIHVPPPPPNQIVYVKAPMPIKVNSIYDAVWVSGTLRTQGKTSQMGDSAYSIEAVKVEPYQ
jgi:hypothetical protein